MKQLSIYLPPLSSDYSGVCSALFDLNCMVIINDAHCCTHNYVNFDEPRWADIKKTTFCTELRTIDAILGDDEKVVRKTVNAAKKIQPDFIAVLGSPVPAIIGMDMRGIAMEIEARAGIPTLGFDTTGFLYYDRGVSDSLLALIKRFAEPVSRTVPNSVNILGLTPLDYSANENAADICCWLEQNGFLVNGSLLMHTNLDQIRNVGTAALNLVVSQSGLDAALYMQQRYGIPYVAGTPVGSDQPVVLLETIRQTLLDKKSRTVHPAGIEQDAVESILIIGDQIIANAIRTALFHHDFQAKIIVGSLFGLEEKLALPGDVRINNESQLISLLQEGSFTRLVADPLICRIPAAKKLKTFKLPHPAVSSRLYLNSVPRFLSEHFDVYVESIVLNRENQRNNHVL